MSDPSTWPRYALSFIRLGRPHFLAGGLVMHGLGAAAALHAGAHLNLPALLWGQVAVTATQFMVHYANDYFDLEADRANLTPTPWSGGSRVLPGGELPARVALVMALLLAGIAACAALVLAVAVHSGPWTLPMIAAALALSWAYSAPPFRLHSRGVGELTTIVIVPLLAPCLGFYLQAGYLTGWLFAALFPLCCLQLTMQLSVNFPDAEGDARAGKRTLVVRCGACAARLYLLALLLAYLALPLLLLAGLRPQLATLPGAGAPLAAWLAWRVGRGGWARPAAWGAIAFGSVALLVGTAFLELLAFALSFFYV